MNKTNELICAHSALLFAVLLGVGQYAVAGWMPLIPPSWDANQIAALFAEDRMRIRIGVSIVALGSVFWWSFSVAIAQQMKRIEGKANPMTYLQMAAASGTVLVIMFSAYAWLIAGYREDLPPSTIQMLNDMAWILIIGAFPPGFIQNISIALCILNDKSEKKLYPRWVGFANLWLAVLFLPGALLPFFKSGPFAWNGIIGFWLVANAFFGWILMMWWMTVKAIKRAYDEKDLASVC